MKYPLNDQLLNSQRGTIPPYTPAGTRVRMQCRVCPDADSVEALPPGCDYRCLLGRGGMSPRGRFVLSRKKRLTEKVRPVYGTAVVVVVKSVLVARSVRIDEARLAV